MIPHCSTMNGTEMELWSAELTQLDLETESVVRCITEQAFKVLLDTLAEAGWSWKSGRSLKDSWLKPDDIRRLVFCLHPDDKFVALAGRHDVESERYREYRCRFRAFNGTLIQSSTVCVDDLL